ncbi:MAG: hypothetical protein ACREEM_18265 [Blastocatellia bacterium]
MWWRVKSFFKEWWQLALSGKSWIEKAIKLSFAAATYLGLWLVVKGQLSLSLTMQETEFFKGSYSTVTCLTTVLALSWLLLTAGMAWIRSDVPNLEVGNELELERRFNTWRLRVTNKGRKSVKVRVEVDKIWTDLDREPRDLAIFPIKLEWSDTNQVWGQELHYNRPHTATVVMLDRDQSNLHLRLLVWGATYRAHYIYLNGVQKVYCELSVRCPDCPDLKPIVRRLVFELDANSPPFYKASTLDDHAWKQLTTIPIPPIPEQHLDLEKSAKEMVANDPEEDSA